MHKPNGEANTPVASRVTILKPDMSGITSDTSFIMFKCRLDHFILSQLISNESVEMLLSCD